MYDVCVYAYVPPSPPRPEQRCRPRAPRTLLRMAVPYSVPVGGGSDVVSRGARAYEYEAPPAHDETFANGSDPGSDVSFVHECFYASARLFQTVLPVLVTRFEEASRYLRDRAAARATSSNDANEKELRSASAAVARDAEYNAYADCARAFLLACARRATDRSDSCGGSFSAPSPVRLSARNDYLFLDEQTALAFIKRGLVNPFTGYKVTTEDIVYLPKLKIQMMI